jgi:hypothetical protein
MAKKSPRWSLACHTARLGWAKRCVCHPPASPHPQGLFFIEGINEPANMSCDSPCPHATWSVSPSRQSRSASPCSPQRAVCGCATLPHRPPLPSPASVRLVTPTGGAARSRSVVPHLSTRRSLACASRPFPLSCPCAPLALSSPPPPTPQGLHKAPINLTDPDVNNKRIVFSPQ